MEKMLVRATAGFGKYLRKKTGEGLSLDDRELERPGGYQEVMLRETKGRIWKLNKGNKGTPRNPVSDGWNADHCI